MKVYKCYKRGKVKIKIDAETIYNNFNRQLYVTLRVIAIFTLIIVDILNNLFSIDYAFMHDTTLTKIKQHR